MPVVTPYQPMGLNQGQSVAFNASTSVNIGPFAGGIVDYVATANCFIAVGSATDAATVNGYPVLAGVKERIAISGSQYLHIIGDGVAGTIRAHPVNVK